MLKTSNAYGNITITDEAIIKVAGFSALDCYGVVDLVDKKAAESMPEALKNRSFNRGIKVFTIGNRIILDLNVIMKYGVSINAVAESLKSAVKYNVEKFTGMIVDSVNVNIVGVRV